MQEEVTRFGPTHIISNEGLSMQATSSEEMSSLDTCRIGVIHTAEQLPFGPFAGGIPDHVSCPSESRLLKQLNGIWSVSDAMKRYAFDHGQLHTAFFVHHHWTYLEEQNHKLPEHHDNWNKTYIGMINPCKVKGLSILLDLAKVCPQHQFLVYKSWGFNDAIGKQLMDLRNVT
jgi:hypothetical protein